MLKIFRRNKTRMSYLFTKKSARMEDLSDVPNNDLTPVPYKSHIAKPLARIEKDFHRKITKSQNMYLDIENRTMFDADIQNARTKPLSILQGQMGVHQKMINEIVINIRKNGEINKKTLDDKRVQYDDVTSKLEIALDKLAARDGKLLQKNRN